MSHHIDEDWDLIRRQLNRDGYTTPRVLENPDLAETVLREVEIATSYTRNSHVTSNIIRQLLNDKNLVTAVENLCGKSFNLWRSAFFQKSSGSNEIGWHHDKHFLSSDSPIDLKEIGGHFSIFFGLTEINATNGLLEVIPKSHKPIEGFDRDERPFHLKDAADHILTNIPDKELRKRVPIVIGAGYFFIFHSALLHRSLEHIAGPKRLGMAVRIAKTSLAIPQQLAADVDIMPFPPKV